MGNPEPDPEPANRSADAALFAELHTGLRRYAAVVGRWHDDPDDLVQEAVSRTLRLGRLSELDRPEAYLRRAILNIAINHAQSERASRARELRVVNAPAAVDHYPSDLDILDRLEPRDRALLFLVDIEGCSFAEAAAALNATPVALRLRASRSRRKLRALLEQETP